MLEILAGHIGAVLGPAGAGAKRSQRLAETDPLTWLFNRRTSTIGSRPRTNRALRAEHLLALLMIDVDKFKLINDRFGHPSAIRFLKAVASAVKQAVRHVHVPTRYGGDSSRSSCPRPTPRSRRVLRAASSRRRRPSRCPVSCAMPGSH